MADVESSSSAAGTTTPAIACDDKNASIKLNDELKDPAGDHPSLAGFFVWTAIAWMTGCYAALSLPVPKGRLIAAAGCLLLLILLWAAGRLANKAAATVFVLLVVVTTSGAWTSVTSNSRRADDIGRYAGSQRKLVRVTGQIDSAPRITAPPRGAMAAFGYSQPATLYELRVQSMESVEGDIPVTGRLLVREPMRDSRLMHGQQLTVLGWLTAPSAPANPGEMDFRQWMTDRDLAGFLSLPEAGSWWRKEVTGPGDPLVAMQATAGHWAMQSLAQGMDPNTEELALLQTLLLGRKGEGLEANRTAFRRVGLAHILSISGAHLGILAAMVGILLVAVGMGPGMMAWVVTLVLEFYLLAIPPQVPVVRAAIMAVMLVWGYALGRRVNRLDPLAIACIMVLMWRPGELLSPGFQLSFGVVAGLLCFTAPVARVLWPGPAIKGMRPTTWQRIASSFMAYVAANLVAFLIAAPLVLYHFHNISPLTVLLSILTLPLITLVLGIGYLKIAIGMALPGLGGDFATILWWLTHALIAVVQRSAEFRIAYLELPYGPGAGWTVAALLVVIALLSGWFAPGKRWWQLGACVVILSLWMAAVQMGYRTSAGTWPGQVGDEVALRVNYFSVGDGNCYLLRFTPKNGRPYTMMYDCGSNHVDGGLTSIIPALQELGVRYIDTLVISHADMDHFNATLDMAWRVEIGQVLLSPQMAGSIEHDTARSAPAYLLHDLKRRGIVMKSVSTGWQLEHEGRCHRRLVARRRFRHTS